MTARAIAYSLYELEFVRARKQMARQMLHAAFVARFGRHDVSVENIKSLCTRHGWSSRDMWTADEDQALRDWFPITTTMLVAAELGRSHSAVAHRARKLGVRKDSEYLATEAGRINRECGNGIATRFQPGNVPDNKGVRRPGWAVGRMKATQFTAGKPSWRYMPIGSTRLVDGYEYTKIADTPRVPYTRNWKPTHVLRWEAVHGPVPPKHALKCLDSNRRNTDPANWLCVPRSMLPLLSGGRMARLGYDQAPAELKPTLLALAQLQHAANKRRETA
jgi:hypothetical protein